MKKTLQTKAVHDKHCSYLEGLAHDVITTTYGINCNSKLNMLRYYHTTTSFPLDIMDDVLERVAVVEL